MKNYTPAIAKKLYSLQQANYQHKYVEKLEIKNSKPAIKRFCKECFNSISKCDIIYCAFYPFNVGLSNDIMDKFNKALAEDEKTHSPNKLKYQNSTFCYVKRKQNSNSNFNFKQKTVPQNAVLQKNS